MSDDLEKRARKHAALATVTRLRIVDHLQGGPHSFTEIAEALGIPSNLLAHHLKVLEQAEILYRTSSCTDRRSKMIHLYLNKVTSL